MFFYYAKRDYKYSMNTSTAQYFLAQEHASENMSYFDNLYNVDISSRSINGELFQCVQISGFLEPKEQFIKHIPGVDQIGASECTSLVELLRGIGSAPHKNIVEIYQNIHSLLVGVFLVLTLEYQFT
ncbi:MAG: hypothetical protein PHH70_01185 [Candidatus Gracilibacteria bacterium]|nr:hypothetical protein [Candidatus Gracilibacteria bacterium]